MWDHDQHIESTPQESIAWPALRLRARQKFRGSAKTREKKATFCAATETSLGSTQEANSENHRSVQGRPQTRRNDRCADFQDSDSWQRGNESCGEKRVLMQVHIHEVRGDICSAQRAHSNAVVGVVSPLAFSSKHRPFTIGPDLSHKRRRPPGRDEHVKRRVVGQRKECLDPNIELVAIETGYPLTLLSIVESNQLSK